MHAAGMRVAQVVWGAEVASVWVAEVASIWCAEVASMWRAEVAVWTCGVQHVLIVHH